MTTLPTPRRVTPQALAVLAILFLLAGVGIVSSLTSAGANISRLEGVKKLIDAGDYRATSTGVIVLGASDRAVSVDGCVYSTGEPATLLLFPRWRGQGASLVATGWSKTQLVKGALIEARVPTAFKPDVPSVDTAIPPTVTETIAVTRVLGGDWYEFERRGS